LVPDPEPDPDPSVRGTDPEIRIRTKMSRIPNTGRNSTFCASKLRTKSIKILLMVTKQNYSADVKLLGSHRRNEKKKIIFAKIRIQKLSMEGKF
jgi:hypothetical protein